MMKHAVDASRGSGPAVHSPAPRVTRALIPLERILLGHAGGVTGGPASVLALQRLTGNAATSGMLQAMAVPAHVQRDAGNADPYRLRPAPARGTPRAQAGGPFTSLPPDLRRVIVEYFSGDRHVKVPAAPGRGPKLRYDAAAPERNAAAWFHGLTQKQADGLVTIYQKMAAAGIWGFVKTLRSGKTGDPVDNGEPDAMCLEQDGNSVSVYFSGDGAGVFRKIGSPFTLGWQVDDPMMGLMHRGQQSVRQRAVTSGLHVSIGPASNFDVHIDRHPPIAAGPGEAPREVWLRMLQHGREELVPNMARKTLAKLLTVPTLGRGAGFLENKVLPSVGLAPSMFYPGSPAWEADNWAKMKALDPSALEKERREGLDTPLSVGFGFRFGRRP